jgi:hypothetical protein
MKITDMNKNKITHDNMNKNKTTHDKDKIKRQLFFFLCTRVLWQNHLDGRVRALTNGPERKKVARE